MRMKMETIIIERR